MNTKVVIAIIAIIVVVMLIGWFMKKEKFVGDFSIDSGFRTVDQAMGGSGKLEDPINQSITDDPNADF